MATMTQLQTGLKNEFIQSMYGLDAIIYNCQRREPNETQVTLAPPCTTTEVALDF